MKRPLLSLIVFLGCPPSRHSGLKRLICSQLWTHTSMIRYLIFYQEHGEVLYATRTSLNTQFIITGGPEWKETQLQPYISQEEERTMLRGYVRAAHASQTLYPATFYLCLSVLDRCYYTHHPWAAISEKARDKEQKIHKKRVRDFNLLDAYSNRYILNNH